MFGISLFSGFIGDALQSVLIPLVLGALLWGWKQLSLVGINISAGHRATLTAAVTKAAGNLAHLVAGGQISLSQIMDVINGAAVPAAMASLIEDVRNSAPDALAHFGLSGLPLEIAKKIIGTYGTLPAATPPAVSATTGKGT